MQTVDLSSFTAGESGDAAPDGLNGAQRATVAAWGASMEEAGFAIIVNHGIPAELLRETFKAARHFFLESSQSDKLKFNHGPYGDPKGGFTAQGTEGVARSLAASTGSTGAPADLVESYVLNRFAMAHPGLHHAELHERGSAYAEAATKLMHLLHRLSAHALGVDPAFFDVFHDEPANVLRFAHYPPLPETVAEGQLRYGAHTDYTGFTILAFEDDDEPSGLEVFVKGVWLPVSCAQEALVVNIGDLWQIWTNGRWQSTLHKVCNPPKSSEAAKRDRFSLPFFTGPRRDALVEPINGDGTIASVVAGDHLQSKIEATRT